MVITEMPVIKLEPASEPVASSALATLLFVEEVIVPKKTFDASEFVNDLIGDAIDAIYKIEAKRKIALDEKELPEMNAIVAKHEARMEEVSNKLDDTLQLWHDAKCARRHKEYAIDALKKYVTVVQNLIAMNEMVAIPKFSQEEIINNGAVAREVKTAAGYRPYDKWIRKVFCEILENKNEHFKIIRGDIETVYYTVCLAMESAQLDVSFYKSEIEPFMKNACTLLSEAETQNGAYVSEQELSKNQPRISFGQKVKNRVLRSHMVGDAKMSKHHSLPSTSNISLVRDASHLSDSATTQLLRDESSTLVGSANQLITQENN
jgi:hypothetical protein